MRGSSGARLAHPALAKCLPPRAPALGVRRRPCLRQVGAVAHPRREFIEDNALKVANLDV